MPKVILIVDDNEINRIILQKILSPDYDLLEAENGQQAVKLLMENHQRIAAVLLDIDMPVLDGYAVLEKMRSNPFLAQIPVIVMTGDKETEERALSLGANDFITKPYIPGILKRRLDNLIRLRESVVIINTLQKDKLTGIWNRETFFQKAEWEIRKKPEGYFILACVDIDNFKVINDQYGTKKGDEVLVQLARVLLGSSETNGGLCGRIMADNFVCLYPRELADSGVIGPNILERVLSESIAMPVTLSVGRYVVDDKSLAVSAMYDRASIAQNTVKGRYDVHVALYDEEMRSRLVREQEIVNTMNSALESGQFEVWFQPQYNHSTGALIGAEALARWRHPQWGLVSPAEFIPVFERNGFVYELDKYIWEQVCGYLRKWLDEGRSPLPVSVNISRYDLFRADLVDVVVDAAAKYGVDGSLLRLEITESAFARSTEQVVDVVERFIARGFTVEIDDFGSGFSSLNTLKDVPAQVLKLDMRFFEGSDNLDRGGNILESVVRMAKWLGMSVIAEGVESVQQADFLKSVGSNYVQGFLYARPMPAEEYEALCAGAEKEERLIALETVENLDNSSFWNPRSMDTLIFNTYVGAACIFEYNNGSIELIRSTDKFAAALGCEGLSVADTLKLRWNEHLGEEGLRLVGETVRLSIATKEDVTNEFVLLDLPGGAERTYLRAGFRVIATAGSRCLVYNVIENITAERTAGERLSKLNESIAQLMDDTPGGFARMLLSPEGGLKMVYANEGLCRMRKMTRAELMASEKEDALVNLHPDDLAPVSAALKIAVETGKTSRIQYRLRGGDGEYAWFSIFGRMSRGDEGETFINIYYTDTTEQEQKVLTVRETVPFVLTAIMESASDFAFAKDRSFRYICCSPAFKRLAGLSTEREVAGRTDYDLFPWEMAEQFRRNDLELFAGGRPLVDYEETITDENGETHYCRASKHILRDSAGEIIGLYGVSRDITAELAALERLSLLNDSVPGGIASYALSQEGMRLTYFNDGFCRLCGLSREEFRELYAADIMAGVHPEDAGAVKSAVGELLSSGEARSEKYRLRGGGGAWVWVRFFGRVTGEGSGERRINLYCSEVTELEKKALSEREMLSMALSSIMEETPALAFVKDVDRRYVFCSRQMAEQAGFADVEALVGRRDDDLLPPEAAEAYAESDRRVLEKGEVVRELSNTLVGKNGEMRSVRTSKFPLRDAMGKVIGIYGIGRDVTEESSKFEQLRLLNDNLPVGLAKFELTPEVLRYTYANDGFFALSGYSREEYDAIASGDFFAIIHPEDLPALEEKVKAVLDGCQRLEFSFRLRAKSGGLRWISLVGAVGGRSGEAVAFNAVLIDVTRERETTEILRLREEELRESEERFRVASEMSGLLIGRYDIRTREYAHNDKSLLELGFPPVIPNVPQSYLDVFAVAEESAEALLDFYRRLRGGESPCLGEARLKLSDGEYHWCALEANVIFDDAGEPIQAIIVTTDITERREKEAVYKRWQQSIEEKAPEDYTMLRWNLSSDMATDAFSGKLLRMADDMQEKNFNQNTQVYAEKRVHPDDRQEYLALINSDAMLAAYHRGIRTKIHEYRELTDNGGFRWLRLTVELLEYPNSTDIEAYMLFENIDGAKREELAIREKAELDPLTGVLNRATFAARAEKLSAELPAGSQCALLMMDIDGFKLLNDSFGHAAGDQALIDMAEAIRSILRSGDLLGRLGGDEFLVALRDMEKDGDIETKAATICALMRKTYSEDVHTSVSIGVAVWPRDGQDFETVYHKADAALYSVKDAGKDGFAFYKPGMDKLNPLSGMPDRRVTTPIESTEDVKHRMLVVEDNPMEAEVLALLFRDSYIVDKVPDGGAALMRLRHYGSAISVVLLDLMMPGMDGFEVLDRMHASADLCAIPVVVVSAEENRETSLEAIRRGASDYVAKPVDPEIIRLRVQSAVSRAENQRLRARNSFLAMQSDEAAKYRAVLDSAGMAIIEHDYTLGTFTYDPSLLRLIAGSFDKRRLWRILVTDNVASALDVQAMQTLVREVANDQSRSGGSMTVRLRTPEGGDRPFRMNVVKLGAADRPSDKLLLTFTEMR